jgi:hypothetical protein
LRTGSAHIDEDEYSDDEEALCVFFIQAITTGRPFSAGSRLALTIESRPALTARRPGSIGCGGMLMLKVGDQLLVQLTEAAVRRLLEYDMQKAQLLT